METQTVSGTIESAYGQTLKAGIDYSGTYEAFQTVDEVRSAGEWPSDKEIVKFVNTKRVANARQKAMQSALDAAGIKKPVADASAEGLQVALRQLIKTFVATGKTEQEATALAEGSLGVKLAA